MANEMNVSFVGTIGADPEVRQAGDKRVLSIRLVHSASVKVGDKFEQTEAFWMDGSLWERGNLIDNVLASLGKGSRVVVSGKLRVEAYQTRDGRDGVSNRLQIDSITPALDWATAQVVKNERGGGSGGGRPAGGGWDAPQGQSSWGSSAPGQGAAPAASAGAGQASDNPWGNSGGSPQGGFGSGFDDEQPF